jgi:DNA-binding NarL/FixJ family response regulator
MATRAIRVWGRAHNRGHSPIIALTASVFNEAVRLTRAAGCDAHVGKPISKATLLRAIDDAADAQDGLLSGRITCLRRSCSRACRYRRRGDAGCRNW